MLTQRKAALVYFICCAFLASTCWAGEYSTNVDALNQVHKEIYLEAQNTLNDWSGEREKLQKAGYLIDSLIASEPGFLPAYIEKARLVIMKGYTEDRYMDANREALEIIKDIQAKDPAYAKSYVLAGHVYTNLHDYENAERSLQAARGHAMEDPWFYYNWAKLLEAKGHIPEAVTFAEQALVRSKDNGKALVAAAVIIIKYAPDSGRSGASQNLASIVFAYFRKPSERLRVAERLIHEYSGRREHLVYAYEIVTRQKQQTPNLPEADLLMARLLMVRGYLVTENYVDKYDPRFVAEAERILASISHREPVRARALGLRVRLAISMGDFTKAHRLIDEAEKESAVPQDEILKSLAQLHFAEGRYRETVAILERLGVTSSELLQAAYEKTGQVAKVHEIYKRRIAMAPKNAWVLGNYASFLLFTLNHIDGAIEYGKRALAEMDYPSARNNLSLALLIRASKSFKSGKIEAAQKDFQFAASTGISGSHLVKYCGYYCFDIKKMIEFFQGRKDQSVH